MVPRSLSRSSTVAGSLVWTAWARRTAPAPPHAVGRWLVPRRTFLGGADPAMAVESVGTVGKVLQYYQSASGLPWWATILTGTLAVRTVLAPINFSMMKMTAKLQSVKPTIEKLQAEVKELAALGDMDGAKQKQRVMMNFRKEQGINPLRTMLGPIAQMPVFLAFFFGIRQLAGADPSLSAGGFGWFMDLSAADPTWILPVLTNATMLLVIELGAETGGQNSMQKTMPMMRNFMRGVCAISIPITAGFPTALFCYWLPSNVFSLLLALVMRSKPVQQAIGVTAKPKEAAHKSLTADEATATYTPGRSERPDKPVVLLSQKPTRKQRSAKGLHSIASARLADRQVAK